MAIVLLRMIQTKAPTETKQSASGSTRVSPLLFFQTSWGLLTLAASLLGGLMYYLTKVAPALVPVDPAVNVPFPQLTRLLDRVCTWTGGHQQIVLLGGLVLLAVGVVRRHGRFNLFVAIVSAVSLGLSYVSISAPTDRLIRKVEASLPEDRVVPDFLPGKVRETKARETKARETKAPETN